MRSTLKVTLRDGRVGTTYATAADLPSVGDFIASLATASPDQDWTIAAAHGPDYMARYGDIVSVELLVEA